MIANVKCVQLHDGWFVAYAACDAITTCWFPAAIAVRRLKLWLHVQFVHAIIVDYGRDF